MSPIFVAGTEMADPPRQSKKSFLNADGVALLSGGVDSFVGAASLLDAGLKPMLVSHMNSSSASAAINAITPTLKKLGAPARPISMTARNVEKDREGESSQRARSLLYMGLACLVADGMGLNDVWLNENGVMAVHVPLTAARAGSLSTRTASPRVLTEFSRLASAALGREIKISNRLVTFTKPEVTALAGTLGIGPLLAHTVSCWQIGRNPEHCGRCVPCLIRQISHEYAHMVDRNYLARPLDMIPNGASWASTAKDNLFHLLMQAVAIDSADEDDLMLDQPELLDAGPGLSVQQSVDMHKRWAMQCLEVAENHPYSRSILQGA
ncbi:7-cyano-7-deazaguanine synthase [Nonomuraea sp. 10N515B]|uniref:7-cyano-7-deazaguanine synthase n=1 Tax=Nonomuraea sp. 10N515B TaxID=3457422 RepID=UPI003FCE41FB